MLELEQVSIGGDLGGHLHLAWAFAVLVGFLDWIARGLVSPSIPARFLICSLILICFAQAFIIVFRRNVSGKPSDNQKEGQDESSGANPSGPTDGQKSGGETEDSGAHQKPSLRRRFIWKLDTVAAFTGVLTIVTGVQVWAFVQSERAALVVGHFQFDSGMAVNRQLTMGYKIRNSGKSTAEITNISLNVKPVLVFPLEYVPVSELAPTQIAADSSEDFTYFGLSEGKPFILNQPTADAIKSGGINFFIYGFIDYTDDLWLFGDKRSYFCFRYVPDRSTQAVATFSGCPIPQHAK